MVLSVAYSSKRDLISVSKFLFCYQLVEKELCWWYFTTRESFRNLITGIPTSYKG